MQPQTIMELLTSSVHTENNLKHKFLIQMHHSIRPVVTGFQFSCNLAYLCFDNSGVILGQALDGSDEDWMVLLGPASDLCTISLYFRYSSSTVDSVLGLTLLLSSACQVSLSTHCTPCQDFT